MRRGGLRLADPRAVLDPLLPATTGCLQVAQFVAGQEPFVALGNVPIAVTHPCQVVGRIAAITGVGLEPANDSSHLGSRRSVAEPVGLLRLVAASDFAPLSLSRRDHRSFKDGRDERPAD